MDIESVIDELKGIAERNNLRIDANLGGSSVGSPAQGMRKRLRQMLEVAAPEMDIERILHLDVGDRNINIGDGFDVAMSLPVASDVWYLGICPSILPFRGDGYQEYASRILSILEPFLRELDNISPLKSLQSYADMKVGFSVYSMKNYIESAAPKVIREMRFETWHLNRSTEFPSDGPNTTTQAGVTKIPENSMGQLYCGLLAFPVGQLGVMEVLSLYSESMTEMIKNNIPFSPDGTVTISRPDGWECVREKPLDGMMSPMTDMLGMCPGVHLVEKGYVLVSNDAEYPAKPFAGHDELLPFQSLRYYFRRDAKWPVPGEFIGLLAKPWPSHVWWFQETSPLLYSGNWVETNHYTSGIVEEILTPESGYGKHYRCNVRGVSVCLASSDFCEYAVGDRVAIIRLNDLGRFMDTTKGNFKWKEMEDLIAREKAEKQTPSNAPYVLNPNMLIVPVSFYKP